MSNGIQNQDTVQTQTKQKKHPGVGLIVLLIIFIIFFLLTTAILGARLNELATRDQYALDLGMGVPEQEIELFRIEYSNAAGEITVRGLSEDAVVAPGTEMNHDVRLRNNGDETIDFVMTPHVEFLTGDEVPVEFKVIDAYGNYILGSEDEWADAETMTHLVHKGSINPDEVFTYHVSWQWAFEVSDEQDEYDTYLGKHNGKVRPGVAVSITTEATAYRAAVKHSNHWMHVTGDGFGCCWCCYLVWLLLLVVIVLLIWICLLKRKYNKLEKLLEESGT